MNTQLNPAPAGTSRSVARAFLIASAAILTGLLAIEAGRRNLGPAALAGDVSQVADLIVLTASAGDNEDVLLVLDQRSENLTVFGVEQNRNVQLFQSADIREAFVQARMNSGGAGGR